VAVGLTGSTSLRYLAVPVTRDAAGALVVSDLPSWVPGPALGDPDASTYEPLTGSDRAAVENVLGRFFGSFLAGDSGGLQYLVPAKAQIRAISPALELAAIELQAAGEGHGLALDQVLGGGAGLRFPDDEVEVDGAGGAVAAVAGDRDGGDRLARVGAAQLDAAGEAAVAGEGDHRGTSWVPGARWLTRPGHAGQLGQRHENARDSFPILPFAVRGEAGAADPVRVSRAVGNAGTQASPSSHPGTQVVHDASSSPQFVLTIVRVLA
jgi:hypothetical protein